VGWRTRARRRLQLRTRRPSSTRTTRPRSGLDLVGHLAGLLEASKHLVGLDVVAFGHQQLVVLGQAQRGIELLAAGDLDRRAPVSPWMISTTPVDVADLGLALGHARLEQLLDARQPAVMSRPATPPVWNVRMVSCVPGSPID
jgi:hypothetical protein